MGLLLLQEGGQVAVSKQADMRIQRQKRKEQEAVTLGKEYFMSIRFLDIRTIRQMEGPTQAGGLATHELKGGHIKKGAGALFSETNKRPHIFLQSITSRAKCWQIQACYQ